MSSRHDSASVADKRGLGVPAEGGRRAAAIKQVVAAKPLAWAIFALDVLLVVVFGLLSDGTFWHTASLQALAVNSSEVVLLAIAAAVVLCLGEIDISLGIVLVVTSVASGTLLTHLAPSSGPALVISCGLLIAIAMGIVCSLVSAASVLWLKVNSFITSLAILGIFTGVVYVVTNGTNVVGIPLSLQEGFGSRLILGVLPVPAIMTLLLVCLVWYLIRRTRFGIHVIACGSARDGALRAGVRVNRTVLYTFLLVGALSGVAGFIDLSRFGTTDIAGHQTDALAAIAGAVIGGTRLSGGRISILGAVSGALLASILQTGLVVLSLPSFYQLIVIGLVLVAAVAIGQRREPQR